MLEESHAVQWGHLQALAGRDLAVELGDTIGARTTKYQVWALGLCHCPLAVTYPRENPEVHRTLKHRREKQVKLWSQ